MSGNMSRTQQLRLFILFVEIISIIILAAIVYLCDLLVLYHGGLFYQCAVL